MEQKYRLVTTWPEDSVQVRDRKTNEILVAITPRELVTMKHTFDQAREALDGLLSVLATYRKTTGVMDGGALKGWEQKGREALAAMEATHE